MGGWVKCGWWVLRKALVIGIGCCMWMLPCFFPFYCLRPCWMWLPRDNFSERLAIFPRTCLKLCKIYTSIFMPFCLWVLSKWWELLTSAATFLLSLLPSSLPSCGIRSSHILFHLVELPYAAAASGLGNYPHLLCGNVNHRD